jgi:hypothetical protein
LVAAGASKALTQSNPPVNKAMNFRITREVWVGFGGAEQLQLALDRFRI